MIHICLPDTEVRQLEGLLQTTTDATFRHRIQIVLMAHRGRKHLDIAVDTGTTPRSVQRWLNAYLSDGLDRLRPRKAKGAKPKLTADLAPLIRQWVIDGPAKQGLDRANWTYAELADHLFKTKGIRVGQSAMQTFGVKHGIRPYRPTYRFLRGDPAKQAKAREELEEAGDRIRSGDYCFYPRLRPSGTPNLLRRAYTACRLRPVRLATSSTDSVLTNSSS